MMVRHEVVVGLGLVPRVDVEDDLEHVLLVQRVATHGQRDAGACAARGNKQTRSGPTPRTSPTYFDSVCSGTRSTLRSLKTPPRGPEPVGARFRKMSRGSMSSAWRSRTYLRGKFELSRPVL